MARITRHLLWVIVPLCTFLLGMLAGFLVAVASTPSVDAHLFVAKRDLDVKSLSGERVLTIPAGYPLVSSAAPANRIDIGFLWYLPVYADTGGMAREHVDETDRDSVWDWRSASGEGPHLFKMEDPVFSSRPSADPGSAGPRQ